MDHGYPEVPAAPYVYQEFPRCLYAPDGSTKAVNTEEAKMALLDAGWSLLPFPAPVPEPAPEASAPAPEQPEVKSETAPRPRGNPNWLKRG